MRNNLEVKLFKDVRYSCEYDSFTLNGRARSRS